MLMNVIEYATCLAMTKNVRKMPSTVWYTNKVAVLSSSIFYLVQRFTRRQVFETQKLWPATTCSNLLAVCLLSVYDPTCFLALNTYATRFLSLLRLNKTEWPRCRKYSTCRCFHILSTLLRISSSKWLYRGSFYHLTHRFILFCRSYIAYSKRDAW